MKPPESWPERESYGLEFRVSVTDEYESRPRPGVKHNDLSTGAAVVLKFGK